MMNLQGFVHDVIKGMHSPVITNFLAEEIFV